MLPRISSIRLFRGYGIVVYCFKPYQGTSAPRSCHTTSIVQGARDDTLERRLSCPSGCSVSTQPQTSPVVCICSGHRACRTARPAGVCRSGAGLEATGFLPSPNPASHFAIVFCSCYCAHQHLFRGPYVQYWAMPTRQREEMSQISTRALLLFATTSPALPAIAQTRIPQGTSETSSSKHRPRRHLHCDGDCEIAQDPKRLSTQEAMRQEDLTGYATRRA
jgi:hypothetical protein